MRGRNQRRAVITAGDSLRVAAAFKRDLKHRHVVGDRCNGDDVIAVDVQLVRIGAEPDQGARGIVLLLIDRDMQRRAMTRVERFLVFGSRDARFDIGDVATGGGGMQAAIGAQFGLGRRDLRRRRQHGQERDEKGGEEMHRESSGHWPH